MWPGRFLMPARTVIFMWWLAATKIFAAPSVRGSTTVTTVVKTLHGSVPYGVSVGDWIGWRFVKL